MSEEWAQYVYPIITQRTKAKADADKALAIRAFQRRYGLKAAERMHLNGAGAGEELIVAMMDVLHKRSRT